MVGQIKRLGRGGERSAIDLIFTISYDSSTGRPDCCGTRQMDRRSPTHCACASAVYPLPESPLIERVIGRVRCAQSAPPTGNAPKRSGDSDAGALTVGAAIPALPSALPGCAESLLWSALDSAS